MVLLKKAKFDEQDSEVYTDQIAGSLKAERVFHDLKATFRFF